MKTNWKKKYKKLLARHRKLKESVIHLGQYKNAVVFYSGKTTD